MARRDVCGDEELRIVLFGNRGPSQFSLTNYILGREEFAQDVYSISGSRKTQGRLAGRRVAVINTPNVFDKELTRSKMKEELRRSKCLSAPGLHAALIALDLEKVSPNDIATLKLVAKRFGDGILGHTLILLSYGGELEGSELEDRILRTDRNLRELVGRCGLRYHVFSRGPGGPRRGRELLEKMERMLKGHGGAFYTSRSYAKAEESVRKEEKKLLKKRVEETERAWRDLEEQYRGEELQWQIDAFNARVGAEARAKAELDNGWLRTSLAVGAGLGLATGAALGAAVGAVEGPMGIAVGGAVGGVMGVAAGSAVQVAMKNIEDRVVPQARTFNFNSVFINRFFPPPRTGL